MPTTVFYSESLLFRPQCNSQQSHHYYNFPAATGSSSSSSSSSASSPPSPDSPFSSSDNTTHSVQRGLVASLLSLSNSASSPPPCLSSRTNSSLSYPDVIDEEIDGPVGDEIPEKPYIEIINQPQTSCDFRYVTEMEKIYGAIYGSEGSRQSHPTVRLRNYNPGPDKNLPIIRCSLCTSEKKLHVHRLVSKVTGEEVDDPHDIEVTPPDFTVHFQHMAIVPTVKEHQVNVLREKTQEHMRRRFTVRRNDSILPDRRLIEREVKDMKDIIHIACLKFEALIDNGRGEYVQLCDPVYSSNIYNSKNPTYSKLEICEASHMEGPCTGGQQIFIFTKKLGKNIKIEFFESEDPNQGWHCYADFKLKDVHHQYAIKFRTPPYKNQNIQEKVTVYYRLVRSTTPIAVSNPMKYTYLPSSTCRTCQISCPQTVATNNDQAHGVVEYCSNKSSVKRRRLNNTPRASTITSRKLQPKPDRSVHVLPPTQVFPRSFPSPAIQDPSQAPLFHDSTTVHAYSLKPQSSIPEFSNSVPLIPQSSIPEFSISDPLISQPTFPNFSNSTFLTNQPLSYSDDLPDIENNVDIDDYVENLFLSNSSPFVGMSQNDLDHTLANLSEGSSQIRQEDDAARYPYNCALDNEEAVSHHMMPVQAISNNDRLVVDGSDNIPLSDHVRPSDSSSSSNEFRYLPRILESRLESQVIPHSSSNSNYEVILNSSSELYDLDFLLTYSRHLLSYITASILYTLVSGTWSRGAKFIRYLRTLKLLWLYNNLENNRQETLLLVAVRSGEPDVVSLLLEAGASVEDSDCDGNTALHLAVMRNDGEMEMVSVLPLHYSTMMSQNRDGYTALHLAVKQKKAKLVSHLCNNSDNMHLKDFINCRDEEGNTALHLAVISRSQHVIVELLKFEEINVNATNFACKTPLALVWGKNDTDAKIIQEILLAFKADPLLIEFEDESEKEGSEDEEDDLQEYFPPLRDFEDLVDLTLTESEDQSEDSEDEEEDDDDSYEEFLYRAYYEDLDDTSLIESAVEPEKEKNKTLGKMMTHMKILPL